MAPTQLCFAPTALSAQPSTSDASEQPPLHFTFGQPRRRSRHLGHGSKQRRSNPFASITSGLWSRLSGGGGGGGIRRTFDRIDVLGKGFVTLGDLEQYARTNGLPMSYASNFASAVLGTAAASDAADGEITYRAFSSFVKSRESALRRAFNHFDKDSDGRISVEDLEVTLRHVAVSCPTSRCIYRCNSRIARELFERTQVMGESSIDFSHFRDFFLLLPQTELMVDYWLASGRCPDLDTRVMIHDAGGATKASPWGHLVAGALAGAASRTATAPLETLRLAVMTGSLEAADLMQGAALIMARGGGWKALFRGNAVNVMRSAPSKALDFFAFDTFKRLLGDSGGYLQTFAAAGLAGATSWTLLYPLEVVRSRITCGNTPPGAGANIAKVMSHIAQSEGVGALYRGLGWSVAAIIPEAAICYGLHDLLKQTYRKWYHAEPDVTTSLAFGVMSAFTGQLVAYPLETVSRRLQVAGAAMPSVIRDLTAQGGLKALYRGVGAATLRLVPMACISFGTYECVRAALVKLGELRVEAECSRISRKCMPISPLTLADGSSGGTCVTTPTPACNTCPTVSGLGGASSSVSPCSMASEPGGGASASPCSAALPAGHDGAAPFVASSCQGGGQTGIIVYCDEEAVKAGLCKQQPPPAAAAPQASAATATAASGISGPAGALGVGQSAPPCVGCSGS